MNTNKILTLLLQTLALCMFSLPVLGKDIIRHSAINNEIESYSLGLLKLALGYSEKEYRFEESSRISSQAKLLGELKAGTLDVIWVGTSNALERDLKPIRIPLFRGLLGNRVFIIRRDKQGLFRKSMTLNELKEIRMGQGRTWADTEILKSAGFNTVTSNKYESLFYMLEGGRFEAFPRGLHEPWGELETHNGLDLQVEQHMLLSYKMPLYFFVEKNNLALAREIELGLEMAIEDGRFNEYFHENTLVKQALENIDTRSRKVFYIHNPYMHEKTPIDRPELWYDLEEQRN